MNSDLRMQLQIARTTGFGEIIRTSLFSLVAIAAIIGFGATGIDIPLAVLTVAATLFGILSGGAALDDIAALREDMDAATGGSAYGAVFKARNFAMLKTLSAILLAATGIAVLAVIFMS